MNSFDSFFKNLLGQGQPETPNKDSFTGLSADQIEAHMRRSLYGTFQLTDAIRPAYPPTIVPTQGYRHDNCRDRNGATIPLLIASVSREILLDLFDALLEPLGAEVGVVLKTSHNCTHGSHEDLCVEHIDTPVLRSTLIDFEDVLLDDGHTGIAVFNRGILSEVQFDEHKLLIAYGHDLLPCEEALHRYRIQCREGMRFISEAEHIHCSDDALRERFQQLACRVGADIPRQDDEDLLEGGF